MNSEEKPSLGDLEHFGIPGMRWGNRKAQLPTADIPRQITATTQAAHAIRNRVGAEVSQVVLSKYGKTAVKFTGKAAVKGAKFGYRAAKGSGIALRLLGKTAKGGGRIALGAGKLALRGGKTYFKTAFEIAKFGLKAR